MPEICEIYFPCFDYTSSTKGYPFPPKNVPLFSLSSKHLLKGVSCLAENIDMFACRELKSGEYFSRFGYTRFFYKNTAYKNVRLEKLKI